MGAGKSICRAAFRLPIERVRSIRMGAQYPSGGRFTLCNHLPQCARGITDSPFACLPPKVLVDTKPSAAVYTTKVLVGSSHAATEK
jgi:hypothetical protein